MKITLIYSQIILFVCLKAADNYYELVQNTQHLGFSGIHLIIHSVYNFLHTTVWSMSMSTSEQCAQKMLMYWRAWFADIGAISVCMSIPS